MRLLMVYLIYLNSVYLIECEEISEHPDIYLNIVQLIQKYGYPVEEHEITTEDGYLLTMFRIPHGKQGSGVNSKPILLMHGLFGQSENYIVSGMINASLAYYLADRDYDVWLGNARGNQHSRKHINLDPDKRDFWIFSYHEIGVFDLPAKIDYILETTKKKKLYYVGHSQGGTAFYIMNSERPEYQDKIALASLLAPAGYMSHFKHPLILPFIKVAKDIEELLDVMNIHEFPPKEISLSNILRGFCVRELRLDLCLSLYHVLLNGGNSGEFDKRMFMLIAKFVPSVAKRQMLHYAQAVTKGFRRYDFGSKMNLRRYRSQDPPDYQIRNITAPIAIYYSSADILVNSRDAEITCGSLPNCVRKYKIPNPKWTHLDFIFGINAEKMYHEPLYKFLEKYKT
ncbi:hypothetical protein HHI36_019428 [Cryptolaemus montrouzieri]|uniref:Lipase n=1 Tax=Cryptolaemus montrouzieri TaxID=559131 RepID=A0ABD2P2V3_9CUCU